MGAAVTTAQSAGRTLPRRSKVSGADMHCYIISEVGSAVGKSAHLILIYESEKGQGAISWCNL